MLSKSESLASAPSAYPHSCDPSSVVKAVRSAISTTSRSIELHAPSIGAREREFADRCIRDGLVGYGWVEHFQDLLRKECRVKYAVAVSSGTAALHLALLCVGVKRDTDVLVPSLTFAATANVTDYIGAIPYFVDSPFNARSLDMARDAMHSSRCSAMIAVDLLGERADIGGMSFVAKAHGFPLVEDAAEAMGYFSGMQGADVAVLSFNNNKIVTTNGGGALLTDDDAIAAKAFELATTSRVKHPWLVEHHRPAFNYRMGNVNAAIGCAQLERLPYFLTSKEKLRQRYRAEFEGLEGVTFHGAPWVNAICVENRDEVIGALQADGIEARCIFTPMHLLTHFSGFPRSSVAMPLCTETWTKMVTLPSGVGLA